MDISGSLDSRMDISGPLDSRMDVSGPLNNRMDVSGPADRDPNMDKDLWDRIPSPDPELYANDGKRLMFLSIDERKN